MIRFMYLWKKLNTDKPISNEKLILYAVFK